MATPARAQATVTLVDNLQEANKNFEILSVFDTAQAFTTGTNEGGYTLSSVELDFFVAPAASGHSVSLWSESEGLPDLKIADLSRPADASTGINLYTAPTETKLQKDTTYMVVVKGRRGWLHNTASGAESAGAQPGWTIADNLRRTGLDRLIFFDRPIERVFKMRVKGTVDAADSDATLQSLALADDEENAIGLSPTPFTPAITAYTAWVANGIDSVTLTAAPTDADAALALSDGTSTETATEATFDLAEGINSLSATVTAADDVTTRTSTVDVVRAAAAPAADAGAIWTARLTVGEGRVGGSPALGYHASRGVGALAPSSFSHESSTVDVGRLLYWTNRGRASLEVGGTGTLAAGEYLLDVGEQSFSVSHDGQAQSIVVDDHGLDWSFGEVVEVKLRVDTSAPQDATLSALELFDEDGDAIALTPAAFDPATTAYTASVPYQVDRVELRASANRPGATTSITFPFGAVSQSGAGETRLRVGSNRFTVKVTASDGATIKRYTLRVTRLEQVTARLTGLPDWHDGATSFTVGVEFSDAVVSSLATIEAAIEIDGGTMSGLESVGGSRSSYRMNLTPGATEPVRIRLRGAASCGESHAICAGDGALFSRDVVRWVSTADDGRLQDLWAVDGDGDNETL